MSLSTSALKIGMLDAMLNVIKDLSSIILTPIDFERNDNSNGPTMVISHFLLT